jgi:ATP-dependent Lhr-like helicase
VPPSPLSQFHACVGEWFEDRLGQPTRAQALAWEPIARHKSTLLLSPTGTGKTLAAFLSAIDRLIWTPPARPGVRVLYVSPLKALAVDVEKNLKVPLRGILERARERGEAVHEPKVLVRTGDTSATERARMARHPGDILITTPESLYLMLTSAARETLASVETVIVDEIHQMVATKRGAHLFLSLERLQALRTAKNPTAPALQRIGLSATQRPLDEVARLLGGYEGDSPRPVTVVDAGAKKSVLLRVESPSMDQGENLSVWPDVHQRLWELIRNHRSTMIFVNSRRLAERLASALNDLASSEIALAHHGSVARERRAEIEDRLKRGDLPAIVATSSLELGIDMGQVDLVVQLEAPPSIASGLQRIGRAGHHVGGVSSGILIPKHRADLLACAAACECMLAGEVESTYYPRSPLDVLAQQIVATVALEPIGVDALYELVRGAAPFAELPRGAYEGVLDMLSGRYPSDAFSGLKARITWDRVAGKLRPREGAKNLAVTNGGTIPDRGLYGVFLAGEASGAREPSRRVGELDEEMVFELKTGEVFLLGASSWRAEEITTDRVLVSPASGEPGKMPFWRSDRAGRSAAFGLAIGKLTRKLAAATLPSAAKRLAKIGSSSLAAGMSGATYVHEQQLATGVVPSDKTVIIERFLDEVGDWRVCILSPLGGRVHAPWATAVLARLRAEHGGETDVTWNDDGIVFRLTGTHEPPKAELFVPPADELEDRVVASLAGSALFATRFRENAARALLLPRRRIGKRTPLWQQRRRSADLLSAAMRFPDFPMLLETYRECLRDMFDLEGLTALLRRIESGEAKVVTVDTERPSPFAASLLFMYVGNFVYENDAPPAERRAQALTIDHTRLRELLGDSELRRLLDPEVVREHEALLQHLTHKARHADGLVDVLLAVGDLTAAEVRARAEPEVNAGSWLAELVGTRRIWVAEIAGEERYVAMEDATRMRDAVGTTMPRGIAGTLVEPVADPVGDLVSRYARTHGPFTIEDVSRRFGWGPAVATVTLERLAAESRVVEGAFTEGREGIREFCDAEVLRALRRKALARLRREVEPAPPETLGRFLPAWQGVDRRARGREALLSAIAQLAGCPLPASVLESEILPARVEGFRPWDLDALTAAGEVVWAGVEPLGTSDGRIALYPAEHEALLALPPSPCEKELHGKIRALLERRGAVFFRDMTREIGGFGGEIQTALWEMVWAGEVTNDTIEPLRSLLRGARSEKRGHRARPGRSSRPPAAGTPPGTEGRWSLRATRWHDAPSDTDKRAALAQSLLDRYGVVTREAVHAERIPGGFSAVYEIFKVMEEAGKIRRGYFIAGHGATQFALPGADERLRSLRAPSDASRSLVLAATDPSNPYGAALPWPVSEAALSRSAGAYVVLHDGALVGYLGKGGDTLFTFLPEHDPERANAERALAEALGRTVDSGKRKMLHITTVDGAAARASSLASAFTGAGFRLAGQGFMRKRTLEVDGALEDGEETSRDEGAGPLKIVPPSPFDLQA